MLGPVSAGLQVAGQLIQGAGYLAQGRFAKKVGARNAVMKQRDAAAQETRVRDTVRRQIGDQLAAQGGSGFQLGAGSALDLIRESQVAGMLDALTLRRQGQVEADAEILQGNIQNMTARNNAIASFFGAASAATGAKADYAGQGRR